MTTEPATLETRCFFASFPWTLEFLWQCDSGVHRLDEDRRVTVSPVGHAGVCQGLFVGVASKRTGEIVHKTFLFDDYMLERQGAEPSSVPTISIIMVAGWYWYQKLTDTFTVNETIDARPLVLAVEAWIGEWR